MLRWGLGGLWVWVEGGGRVVRDEGEKKGLGTDEEGGGMVYWRALMMSITTMKRIYISFVADQRQIRYFFEANASSSRGAIL